MIVGFRHAGLERFFRTGSTRRIDPRHASRLRRILAVMHRARSVQDVALPGFRLHRLKGRLAGRWAIDVSGNWRVTFVWAEEGPDAVDYEDYH